jgi:GT2 family glycosyltransferase
MVSVIVPTYARPDRLVACLEALAAQDAPREGFEVVVSDDGSPMPAAPVVAAFADRMTVRCVRSAQGGPASARNAGAAAARGDWLAFTDDDCRPAPGWVSALAARAAADPGGMVAGPVRNALPDNPYSSATQHISSYVADVYRRRPAGSGAFYTTSNLALAAERFRALGGFSTEFALPAGEDYDLCDRFRHAGGAIVFAPEAVVNHEHHLGLRSFVRQHMAYGRGLLRFRVLRARRTEGSPGLEPLGFYLGLLACPLRAERGARAWLQVGLVALAQAATAIGGLSEAARVRRT